MTKRTALLASTAIIALLSACSTPSATPASSNSGGTVPTQNYPAFGGFAW